MTHVYIPADFDGRIDNLAQFEDQVLNDLLTSIAVDVIDAQDEASHVMEVRCDHCADPMLADALVRLAETGGYLYRYARTDRLPASIVVWLSPEKLQAVAEQIRSIDVTDESSTEDTLDKCHGLSKGNASS